LSRNLHPSSSTEYHLGKYFLEEVESNLFKWISELIHPLQQYIYSSTILGGKDFTDSDEEVFFKGISKSIVGALWVPHGLVCSIQNLLVL
jgi:hypothetical protein